MNHTKDDSIQFLQELKNIEVNLENRIAGIAVPAINLNIVKEYVKNNDLNYLNIISQNFYYEESGAFTGEISPNMLKNSDIDYVLIGHSERRDIFKESNDMINLKLKAALKHNLTPVLCYGESLSVYESNNTNNFVDGQLKLALKDIKKEDIAKIIFAYEPIWAIGTGKVASPQIAESTIAHSKEYINSLYNNEVYDDINLLYGGSVKPNNIKELLEQSSIDGVLVGGASLDSKSFAALINYEEN